jgi:hypothetical protein
VLQLLPTDLAAYLYMDSISIGLSHINTHAQAHAAILQLKPSYSTPAQFSTRISYGFGYVSVHQVTATVEINQWRGTGTYVAVGTAASNFVHDIYL